MQVQILIPSENQRRLSIDVKKEETVSSFRRMVANEVKVPEKNFLLIAFGKIMMDKKLNNEAATLFSTYRIRHQTCIFVHINVQNKKPRKTEVISSPNCDTLERTQIVTRRETNVVSVPFEDFNCDLCHNNDKTLKCLECGCAKCQYKTGDPLICDQCDNYWHLKCANLTRMPTGQYWYCPDCINLDGKLVIGKGQRVNEGIYRKRAIVLRDVDCVIVPPQHVGKIPGIYCGQSWELRSLAYDWGIHRAKSIAIAGSSYTGAVSLVLSSGLREDRDEGYQFVYSGTGGQLKAVNGFNRLRMKEDQILTRYNKALAITCYAPFNDVTGAKALNWRKSRPIRVCRTSNRLNSHPEFAPSEGVRYDGLYKVVKYWPHRDKKTGFIIWKYLLRRDDQEVPPWMAYCKTMSTKRGLRMICDDENETKKLVRYTPPRHIQRLITKDRQNNRLWAEMKQMEFWSEYEFLHYLFDTAITCSSNVCPKPIKDPVTTPCGHICCMKCLEQSQMDRCFTCRTPLPKKSLTVNDNLVRILQSLNWAYGMEHDNEALPSAFLEDIALEKEEEDLDFDIKQEFEYPTISETISTTNDVNTTRPKKVRVVIEYLGNSPEQNKRQKIY